MDTFTAIPDFFRAPLKVLDMERYEEWLNNPDLDAEPPTKTQIFVVYVKGPGTPVPVQIEVDRIETEYTAQAPNVSDEEFSKYTETQVSEYADKWRRVNMLLRRNLLLAVVRGLDSDSANILAGEENNDGRTILERGGWIRARPSINEENKADVENAESEGEAETGE